MEREKINVTVSLYFEVKDSETFGGKGGTGYCASRIDLRAEDLLGFQLHIYAQEQISGLAELLEIPEKNIKSIARQEYEENTEEE